MTTTMTNEVSLETSKKELEKVSNMVTVYYVTDPVCSYCWEFEPAIRKFVTLYKDKINFKIILGGLMPSLESIAMDKTIETGAKTIGEHWRENSKKFKMPISGEVMFKDPVTSSFPASLAFKQVQKISDTSSQKFLRGVREELFAFNLNISKDKVLEDILFRIDRNGKKIVSDSKNEETKEDFDIDLKTTLKLEVTGFPTVVFKNEEGKIKKVVGLHTFNDLEEALNEVSSTTIEKNPLPTLKEMFNFSRNIFKEEIKVMYDLKDEEIMSFIEKNLGKDTYEVRECLNTFFIIHKPGL